MPSFLVESPDGRKQQLDVPEGTSQDEIMARVANMATATSSISATPELGIIGRVQQFAERGARPLTPGGEPVSPLKTVVGAATDPETLLGTAGEIAGLASPIPGGGVLGAGVGGATGRAIKRAASGQPILGEGGAGELATSGLVQAGGAGLSRLAAGGATTGARMFTGTGPTKETAEAVAAREFLEPRLAKTGVNLVMTPAEATESSLQQLGQNIAEGGFFSTGRMNTYFNNRRKGLQVVADDFLNEIAPHLEPAQLADLFTEGVAGRNVAATLTSTGLRKDFEERAGHIVVQTGPLRRVARSIIKSSKRRGHVGAAREGVPLAEQIMDLPPTSSISDLAQLRSTLLDQKRGIQAGERVPLGTRRTINKLIRRVDSLIETSVKDPETIGLWRESNALVKERVTTTDSGFLKKLVRISDPAQLGTKGGGAGGDVLVNKVFANENSAKAASKALGIESPEFKQLQRRYIERAFADVTDTQGNLSGTALLEKMVGKGSQNEARFVAAFPDPAVRRNILQFGNALKTLEKQGGEGGGQGKMLIQLTQGGMLLGGLTAVGAGLFTESQPTSGAGAGTIATALVGPSILAQMMTRRPTARLLTMAMKTPVGSKLAASLVSRIAFAAKQIEEENAVDDFLQRVPAAGRGTVRTTQEMPASLSPAR